LQIEAKFYRNNEIELQNCVKNRKILTNENQTKKHTRQFPARKMNKNKQIKSLRDKRSDFDFENILQ
jgi:hypothetical protein